VLVDSHCHLDDYEDLPAVLARAYNAGVDTVLAIGIGNGPEDMHRALEIAQNAGQSRSGSEPQVYASAGIHPQEAHRVTPEALRKLRALVQHERCLAVGEIGLDYYHADNPLPEVQKQAFREQLEIAASADKPITIHCRTSELARPDAKAKFGAADAWEDLLALIAEHWSPRSLPGIMHCFSGGENEAERSLEAGFYLSFAGNLTYPKATVLQAVAKSAPADRLLVETDAPFLTPVPLRGQQNEPAHVALTARFLAELREVSFEQIAAETTANFRRLFSLPG
jgi:TatD DNase family protein